MDRAGGQGAGNPLRLSGLQAPGEPETFEQPADSSSFPFDRGEPCLDPVDSSAESKHEPCERNPSSEYRDELG